MEQIRAQEHTESTRYLFQASPLSELPSGESEAEDDVEEDAENSESDPSDRSLRSRSRRGAGDSDEETTRSTSLTLLQTSVSMRRSSGSSTAGRLPLCDITGRAPMLG